MNGFISLGIHGMSQAVSAPFVPVAFRLLNRKVMLLLGGLMLASYVFCFINPVPSLLYVFAAVSGIGGSFIRVAQGADIVVNSTERTISRNVSIFFAMYMSGTFSGNLYVFFSWNGEDSISEAEQVKLALILGSITVTGSFIFLLSRSIPADIPDHNLSTKEACSKYILSAWRVAKHREIMFLFPVMAFMGLEMAFFQGMFPTCIGSTHQLENSKRLVGLVSICVGVGELAVNGINLLPISQRNPKDSQIYLL